MFLPALRSAFISARLARVGEDFKRRWNRRFSRASGSRRESKDRASSKIDSLNEEKHSSECIHRRHFYFAYFAFFIARTRAHDSSIKASNHTDTDYSTLARET